MLKNVDELLLCKPYIGTEHLQYIQSSGLQVLILRMFIIAVVAQIHSVIVPFFQDWIILYGTLYEDSNLHAALFLSRKLTIYKVGGGLIISSCGTSWHIARVFAHFLSGGFLHPPHSPPCILVKNGVYKTIVSSRAGAAYVKIRNQKVMFVH